MPFKPLKGKITRKEAPLAPSDFMASKFVAETMYEMQKMKDSLESAYTAKIQEVDAMLEAKTKEFDAAIEENKNTLVDFGNQLIEEVQNLEQLQGAPGMDANEEVIFERLSEKMPKSIDEKAIIAKVVEQIPQNKASLKVIQESFETDPMSIIEKIMEMADGGKFKLKTKHVDGLEQTMRSFQSQLGRGYLHGGGDTVVAGTNVTIVSLPNGTKQINAGGGGGTVVYNETPTPAPDDVTTVFTLVHTPSPAGSLQLFLNGQLQIQGTDYTLVGPTITMAFAPLSGTILTAYYTY